LATLVENGVDDGESLLDSAGDVGLGFRDGGKRAHDECSNYTSVLGSVSQIASMRLLVSATCNALLLVVRHCLYILISSKAEKDAVTSKMQRG
jgi:hypothetical protein